MQVLWQEYQQTDWNVLPAEDWEQDGADGRIWIKQSGYNKLPERFCLAFDGKFAERVPTFPAEMLRSLVRGVGLLDTVQTGIGQTPMPISLFGHLDIGWSSWTFNTPAFRWQPSGNPSSFGFINGGVNPSMAPFAIRPPASPSIDGPDGFDITYGCTETGSGGPGRVLCFAKYPMIVLDYQRFAARLPDGTEILEAAIEASAPAGMIVREVMDAEFGVNWYPTPQRFFTSPVATSTSSSLPVVGWTVLGENTSGIWLPISSVTEASSGALVAGKIRVIDFKKTFELLLALRNSPWKRLAIYPSSFAGQFLPPPGGTPEAQSGILNAVRLSMFSWQITGNNGLPDGNVLKQWQGKLSYRNLTMSGGFGLGSLVVKFKLPTGAIKTQRLTYGNWPPMQPRS